jgi:serine/threonine protein kinase
MYQAPEVLERRSYRGESVDIFSIGVILFLMVTGSMPYLRKAAQKDALYKYIYHKKKESYWSSWASLNLKSEQVVSKPKEEEGWGGWLWAKMRCKRRINRDPS